MSCAVAAGLDLRAHRPAARPAARFEGGGRMPDITPCLWFDTEAEEAAEFYLSVFPNSAIIETLDHTDAGPRAAGSVMVVSFELDGKRFMGLNGGPEFKFNEAISLQIDCRTQDDV